VGITSASRPILLSLVNFLFESNAVAILAYVPVAVIMAICLLFLASTAIPLTNNGFYDPVLYRNWKFPGVASNPKEDKDIAKANGRPPSQIPASSAPSDEKSTDKGFGRSMIQRSRPGPRFLIYVKDLDLSSISPEGHGVASYMDPSVFEDYVFVSYTRTQFDTSYDKSRPQIAITKSHHERLQLLKIGIRAAKRANVPAFWLDCFPRMDTEDARQDSEDVYRICDIVRSAQSLVIAVNEAMFEKDLPSIAGPRDLSSATDRALKGWGSRLWTMPEILLCKAGQKVPVFSRDRPDVVEYRKQNLGYLAWSDWEETMKLVDHYEGSVRLTQLELISTAHGVLRSSAVAPFGQGDYAYALMGLLRQRPKIVKSDTDFLAFARLSLSNSSDSILERLLCMQPVSTTAPWYEMRDAYGADLWEIEPTCQIAAIDDHSELQTVLLDGAYGATINWGHFHQVAFMKRPTLMRRIMKLLLPVAPHILIVGIAGLVPLAQTVKEFAAASNNAGSTSGLSGFPSGDSDTSTSAPSFSGIFGFFTAIFAIVVAIGGIMILASPIIVKGLFYGKFWSTQARFYGIEGYCKTCDLEEKLFGKSEGRLKWSVSSSIQSMPAKGTDYEGADPATTSGGTALAHTLDDGRRLFTLVDTYVLETTVFYAYRPPTAVMICGKEGGMQRAVLCSYDWRTQTFCREVVLRMKTIVLNRMSRVDKFRFSLRRES